MAYYDQTEEEIVEGVLVRSAAYTILHNRIFSYAGDFSPKEFEWMLSKLLAFEVKVTRGKEDYIWDFEYKANGEWMYTTMHIL